MVARQPTPDDEDVLVAQRSERSTRGQVERRVETDMDRQLDDRDVGLGAHDERGNEGPVVEAPVRVAFDREPCLLEQCSGPLGDGR